MLIQPDLFGTPLVAGLRQSDGVVTPDEERSLIAAIDRCELTPFQFQGWQGRRLTASFGWRYDYDKGSLLQASPIPDWLLPIRERAAGFAGLPVGDFVQALVIRYDPGAGIGWHRDRPLFEDIVGISLGAPANFRFRRRKPGGFDRVSAPLLPRAAYHLSGGARHDWEHSIAEMDATRWSITFRTFSPQSRP